MSITRSASTSVDHPTAARTAGYAPFVRTMLALAMTALFIIGQLYAVIPLLNDMGRSWSTAPSAMTWVTSTFGFGYAAGFLVSGPLSDRYGPRRTILTGLSVAALTTATVAAAPGFAIAIVLRVLQGFATAFFMPGALSYIAERVEPHRRTLMVTSVTTSFLASAAISQIAAQGIAAAAGWRTVFLVGAVATAVAATVLWRVILPDTATGTASAWRSLAAMPGLLRRPRLRALFAAAPLVLGAFVAVYTGLQLTGVAEDANALLALRASALPAILAVPLLTPWLRRVPGILRIGASLMLAAIAVAVIGLLTPGTVGLAALLMVLAACVTTAGPALIETIGQRAGTGRGTAIALYGFLLFVGTSAGSQLAGALAGRGLSTLMYVLAGALALAGLLALSTRR